VLVIGWEGKDSEERRGRGGRKEKRAGREERRKEREERLGEDMEVIRTRIRPFAPSGVLSCDA
jgi:hypothetical protein